VRRESCDAPSSPEPAARVFGEGACWESASTEPRVPGACTENAELGLSAPRGVLGEAGSEGW
jgi:hypothetical protein